MRKGVDLEIRNGDREFSTAYVWADGNPVGGGFPNKAASGWGRVIAPLSTCDPNSNGDLDGNGSVEFPDFLILSANFGTDVASHNEGDIDCNGSVEFPDFLILSANFGQNVATTSVPEPSGLSLPAIGGFLLYLRRRK